MNPQYIHRRRNYIFQGIVQFLPSEDAAGLNRRMYVGGPPLFEFNYEVIKAKWRPSLKSPKELSRFVKIFLKPLADHFYTWLHSGLRARVTGRGTPGDAFIGFPWEYRDEPHFEFRIPHFNR